VSKVLVIGYGNPGRQDDGLGPAAAEAVERLAPPDVTVEARFQLGVEDAAAIAAHDVVVFIDAAVEGPEPFAFHPVTPKTALDFSSHLLEPPALMALARDTLGAQTQGYVLAIRGYRFDEFGDRISTRARMNLAMAVLFVKSVLGKGLLPVSKGDATPAGHAGCAGAALSRGGRR